MKNFLNKNCGESNNLSDEHLKNHIKNFEIEQHAEDRRAWQDASNESGRLKNLLKRAVETESAPQSLVDSIRLGIRR